jgi:hypothetical protein
MNTLQFLAELRRQSIEISVEAEGLRYRSRKGALTPELRRQLAERKEEILVALRAQMPATGDCPEGLQVESRGLDAGGSRVIAGRSVKQLYFQDELESWFQDMDGRFWHLDLATNTLTELKPRDTDAEEPIPSEAWTAFGTLLGILILRREGARMTGKAQAKS